MSSAIAAAIEGYALVYDVVDEHGTMFERGCLDRARRDEVKAGKVKLFIDHGGTPKNGYYATDKHIGTVVALDDVQLPDGKWAAKMRANIFDSPAGRAAIAYLGPVLDSKAQTGLSVAGHRDTWHGTRVTVDGHKLTRYTDIGLVEISITPVQSVPGAIVTKLTPRPAEGWATPAERAVSLRRSFGYPAQPIAPASPGRQGIVSMDERLKALRRTYAR